MNRIFDDLLRIEILHHIVLGLNVSSVRSFTQMEGVFFFINPFFKVTLFKVVVLVERKEDTYPTVYESYMA